MRAEEENSSGSDPDDNEVDAGDAMDAESEPDCNCITCQAVEYRNKLDDSEYKDEDELRRLISTGRYKDPFFDARKLVEFHFDLYNLYRVLFTSYNRHQWLSGCPGFTSLECFPCTLFNNGEDDFFVSVTELSEITSLAANHSKSVTHLSCVQKWLAYQQPEDFCHVDEEEKERIFIHDETVRKNRELARVVIHTTVFLSKSSNWFRKRPLVEGEYDWQWRQSDSDEEPDPGPQRNGLFYDAIQLIVFMKNKEELTEHMTAHLDEWTTLESQTGCIWALAEFVRMNIKSKLEKAEFVSIIIDEPYSLLHVDHFRTSTILRFVDDEGVVHETLLGLYEVEHDLRPPFNSLFSHVLGIVESLSLKDKLIAVSCDGRSLIASQMKDFQSKLHESFPRARFVHCYGHPVDYVIEQSVEWDIDSTGAYFNTFIVILEMFRDWDDRQEELREFVSQKTTIQKPWHFDRKLVHTLDDYRDEIIEYFGAIPDRTLTYYLERNNGKLDDVYSTMKEINWAFCSKLFSKIFKLLEPLNNAIISTGFDVISSAEHVRQFLAATRDLKDKGFDGIWAYINSESDHLDLGWAYENKSPEDLESSFKNLFNKILDHTINHVTSRFDYLPSMDFLYLLDPQKFSTYRNDFPVSALISLTNQYNWFHPQLQNELETLYNLQELDSVNIEEFLLHFNELDCRSLLEPLTEVRKLVKLILTFPLCPISTGYSKYKKAEIYLRVSNHVDLKKSLPDLSLISLEGSFRDCLNAKSAKSMMLIDKIIDMYAEKVNKKDQFTYINPNNFSATAEWTTAASDSDADV